MKLKFLSALLLLFCLGCAHHEPTQRDQWNIRWVMGDAEAIGQLYLSEGNQARIIIEEPDGLLFFQAEDVYYQWQLTQQKLILTRVENGIGLEYDILEQSNDYMRLSYARDFTIEIYR